MEYEKSKHTQREIQNNIVAHVHTHDVMKMAKIYGIEEEVWKFTAKLSRRTQLKWYRMQ